MQARKLALAMLALLLGLFPISTVYAYAGDVSPPTLQSSVSPSTLAGSIPSDVPWAWGLNDYGQLGDGTNTNQKIPVLVSNLSGITAVAGGRWHSLALRSDGTVWAWGRNDFGQLGDGTNTNQNTPVQVSNLSGVVAIAAGLG
ncbi:MAG TPA: RCC1 repeat- and reductase domain-containing protein, partial [Dehalococcoidia bacterium]|nr:RCC1 repeat- and reductase domain-containing protein [Dehalococcoidia bacterium]